MIVAVEACAPTVIVSQQRGKDRQRGNDDRCNKSPWKDLAIDAGHHATDRAGASGLRDPMRWYGSSADGSASIPISSKFRITCALICA